MLGKRPHNITAVSISEVLLKWEFGFVVERRVKHGCRLADIATDDVQVGLGPLVACHIVDGDATGARGQARVAARVERAGSNAEANAVGHRRCPWAERGGQGQAVVVIHQRDDRLTDGCLAHVPVGRMHELVVREVRCLGHRRQREIAALGEDHRKDTHVQQLIAPTRKLAHVCIRVSEVLAKREPTIHFNQQRWQLDARQQFDDRLAQGFGTAGDLNLLIAGEL